MELSIRWDILCGQYRSTSVKFRTDFGAFLDEQSKGSNLLSIVTVICKNKKKLCSLFVEHLIIQLSCFVTSISSVEYLCLVLTEFVPFDIFLIFEAVFLREFFFLGV